MSVTYAAAVSTPNGDFRAPQIQARACSDPDLRASFEAEARKQEQNQQQQQQKKPQRPGAGIRAKTSFRGWGTKKEGKTSPKLNSEPYVVEESRPSVQYPRAEYRPGTGGEEEECVYVLTLKLTEDLGKAMDGMRERYFPKHLNRTGAHLTLFHALPHSRFDALERGVQSVAQRISPFDVSTGKPFRMRKGVGVNVDEGYKNMKTLHEQLQTQWLAFLSEQDAAGFRPHWTVMNKVDDEKKVDGAFATIRQELSEGSVEGRAVGLDLWRYERGDWVFVRMWPFGEVADKTLSPRNRGSSSGDGPPGKRPGMFKRGSSVGDALRTMSFRRRS